MEKPITLCDRCDQRMHCLLNYDGKPCRKNRSVEPTNADLLRSLEDKDLAEHLFLHIADGACPPDERRKNPKCSFNGTCIECWHDWLRKDADDGDQS